jgi:lipopolysaccharide export system protein LptA
MARDPCDTERLLMRIAIVCAGLCLSIVLAAVGVAAAAQDGLSLGKASNQPIEVTSKKLTAKVVPNGVELTFDGKVKVKQEDMTLSCDKMVVLYEEDKKPRVDMENPTTHQNPGKKYPQDISNSIKSAVGSGNVKMVKNEISAVAGKALFDNVKRTVTLTEGPPRVWQGPHALSAPTIIIYLDESRAELLGTDDSEKNGVKAILNPAKQKKEK